MRGSYRSLSLVIYGNTAEDLGQFNIDFNDSSLNEVASSTEGKLEELPVALHSINRTLEESVSSPKILSLTVAPTDLSIEVKQLLHLTLRLLESPCIGSAVHKVSSTLVLASSSYISSHLGDKVNRTRFTLTKSKDFEKSLNRVIGEAREELRDIYDGLLCEPGTVLGGSLTESISSENEVDMVSSKQLVDMLSQYFNFRQNALSIGDHKLPQV